MKTTAALLLLASVLPLIGQTAKPEGTTSRAPARISSARNDAGFGDLTFTNSAGVTYTADQLRAQLRQLRGAVDEVLPTLAAFAHTFSNNVSSGQQTLGGALSEILSGVFKRDTNSSTQADSGGLRASNVLAVLQRVLGANAATNSSANTNPFAAGDLGQTYQQILTLQTNLEPLPTLLDNLNVAGGPTNQGPASAEQENPRLSPTGRGSSRN